MMRWKKAGMMETCDTGNDDDDQDPNRVIADEGEELDFCLQRL